MKRALFLLLFLLTAVTLQAQDTENCKNFHEGTFKYLETGSTITRTDKRQRELNKETGIFFDGTLKWISECEYEIILEKSNAQYSEEIIGKSIRATITSIEGNIATIEYIGSDGIKRHFKIEKTEVL